jgi:excisionase family DNA binding protein
VADQLGVSTKTVRRLVASGALECERVNRRILVTDTQLRAYLASQKNASTSPGIRLLRREQAAKYLGLSVSSLDGLNREGSLPHVKVKSSTRYDIRDLDAYIERMKVS